MEQKSKVRKWAQNSKQRIEQISQYAPLMLFLSIVALVLTIVGLVSSNHQGSEQLERINHAINNISTTYLSNFPDHLEHINKYLAEDPSSVSICIDVFPYAIFSSPALFEEYIGNLMMLAKKGKTHINYVVYSSQTAQSARDSFLFSDYETVSPEKNIRDSLFHNLLAKSQQLQTQYSNLKEYNFSHEDKDINKIFSNINNVKKKYLTTSYDHISWDDYCNMLTEISEIIDTSLGAFHPELVKINYSNKPSSVFYWLFDNNKAIYVFSDNITETAYRTIEPTLIHRFISDINRKLN